MILNITLDYGGQQEIVDATKRILGDVVADKVAVDNIDAVTFSEYLCPSGLPDLEPLIQTSGEYRIGNYMLWELAYLGIVLTTSYYLDFSKRHLPRAVLEHQCRERRFGGEGKL